MAHPADRFLELGTLEALAGGASPVHSLDPRAKVLAVAGLVVAVASFGRFEVAALLPYALFPAVLLTLGAIPGGYILRRMLAALPFVLALGLLNPVLDRAPMLQLGPVTVSAGWLSLASILVRFALTVGTALLLVATTPFHQVCMALEKLGLPRVFALQLAFLYRYAFVLAAETARLVRARSLRAFGRRLSLGEFTGLAGGLLLRTWDRAQRIHTAMLARAFTGDFQPREPLAWNSRDTLFTLGWLGLFAALRWARLPQLLGQLAGGAQ